MAGSIQKRGNNKYLLTVSLGRGAKGKRLRYTQTIEAKNDKEAEKKLAEFLVSVEKGTYIEPSKLTFFDFVQRWVRDYAKNTLAPKTFHRYQEMLKSRIIPSLGHIMLESLKPTHLLEFYNNLREDGIRTDGKKGGLAERTILHHHRLISAILSDAVEWQLIISNPANRVKPPKAKKKDISHYNEEQLFVLLQKLDSEPINYRLMVYLAITGGLRRGEIMGLDWSDIDFEKKTLEVKKSSQYLPSHGVFLKDPKNESSKRILTLPTTTILLLLDFKAYQEESKSNAGDKWKESDRIFTAWNGEPAHPDTISGWFAEFIRKSKLPHITFHGLRHTNASLLIAEGLDLKTISTRLGHSTVSTTTDIYAHALRKPDIEAANKMEQLLSKNPLR